MFSGMFKDDPSKRQVDSCQCSGAGQRSMLLCVQCSAVQCSAVQWSAVQYTEQWNTQGNTVLCAVQWSAVHYAFNSAHFQPKTVQCHTWAKNIVQCSAGQESIVQDSAVQCSAVQWITVQCSALHSAVQCSSVEIAVSLVQRCLVGSGACRGGGGCRGRPTVKWGWSMAELE